LFEPQLKGDILLHCL